MRVVWAGETVPRPHLPPSSEPFDRSSGASSSPMSLAPSEHTVAGLGSNGSPPQESPPRGSPGSTLCDRRMDVPWMSEKGPSSRRVS